MNESDEQEQQLQKIALAIDLARKKARSSGFYWFIDNIFRYCFEPNSTFVTGKYLEDIAKNFEENKYTIDVSGRDHFKSTRLHCDICYAIFIATDNAGFEAQYFSYSESMASYQLKKLKQEIAYNPFFSTLIDRKPQAESILSYSWGEKGSLMTIHPKGLLGNNRGIHCDRLYVDDPLKTETDGAAPDPVAIKKINNAIRGDLLPMIKKPNGICRMAGTPQTGQDFFFDKKGIGTLFKITIAPSIIDEPNKVTLWPERYSYDQLNAIRISMDADTFDREYQAMPVALSRSYIKRDKLIELSTRENCKLEPQPLLQDEIVVAGLDIGKKVHPSHLALFAKKFEHEDDKGKDIYSYRQVYGHWFDGIDYKDQVDHVNRVCEYFNVSNLYYDDTRGELQSYAERGKLDGCMQPIVMSSRRTGAMAAHFGGLVNQNLIHFINERRQISQILMVDNDLRAQESSEGHADSFYSCALAVWEPSGKIPKIWSLYSDDRESKAEDDNVNIEGMSEKREKTWSNSTPQTSERRWFI
jgi:hypothetical protein